MLVIQRFISICPLLYKCARKQEVPVGQALGMRPFACGQTLQSGYAAEAPRKAGSRQKLN